MWVNKAIDDNLLLELKNKMMSTFGDNQLELKRIP
jgi:hypothetical protein